MKRIIAGLLAGLALTFITVGATAGSPPRVKALVPLARMAAYHAATPRHHRRHQHRQRRYRPVAWSHCTLCASWYNDEGPTASGYHADYGVANKYLAFGTRVTFRYHGNVVTAIVDDRGPYVAGRDWDLDQNTAAALGFSGVDSVDYYTH